jgi:hypothetical protein
MAESKKNISPFEYLKIDNDPLIKFNYSDFNIDTASTKSFVYTDIGCKLLKPELKQFFIDRGLEPAGGNLWGRTPDLCPVYYHTDVGMETGKDTVKCAVNWLLSEEPGVTEWSYAAENYCAGSGISSYIELAGTWYWPLDPEFTAVLDKPMLIRVDVPHRVNTLGVTTLRISYSLRFKNHPNWDRCVSALKGFTV